MIDFLKNFKLKAKSYKLNRGMTIEELIVVLIIFAVISTVVIFNYTNFQSKVDIENLANDIAQQVVQAQNSSLSGFLPPSGYTPDNLGYPTTSWKPSYGVYFNTSGTIQGADSTHFIYFVDLDNSKTFTGENCNGECLTQYSIPNNNRSNNKISDIRIQPANSEVSTPLVVFFTRPSSFANFYSNSTGLPLSLMPGSCVEITISNQKGNITSKIDLYPSGRVQIK
jgi:type II secretory pathway pseudopilin PulG